MTTEASAGPSPLAVIASRWLVALCALSGLMVGLVIYALRTPVFEAATVINVNNPVGTMEDEASLVMSARVLNPVTAQLGFAPDVTVEPNSVADLLTITVRASTGDAAATAASVVAATYEQAQTSVAVSVARAAEVPASPVAPSRIAHVLIGSAVGAAIGAVLSWLRSLRVSPPARPRRPGEIDASGPALSSQRLGGSPQSAPARVELQPAGPGPTSAAPVAAESSATAGDSLEIDIDALEAQIPRRGRGPAVSTTAPSTIAPANPAPTLLGAFSAALAGAHSPTSLVLPASENSGLVDATTTARPSAPPLASVFTGDPLLVSHDDDGLGDGSTGFLSLLEATSIDRAIDVRSPSERAGRLEAADRASAAAATAQQVDTEIEAAISAVEARHRSELSDQRLATAEATSRVDAEHERQVGSLKTELAETHRRNRAMAAQLKRHAGDDQHRVGDLQLQVEALESELSTAREQLDRDRLAHARVLTAEREAADHALDNARREHLESRGTVESAMRRAIAEHRAEIEAELTTARAEHRTALENQHVEYEAGLGLERDRHRRESQAFTARGEAKIKELQTTQERAMARQADQLKQVVADLRRTEKDLSTEIDDLRQGEQQYRTELTTARQHSRDLGQRHGETEQGLRDEIATGRKALEAEKARSAALREDVIRRTAEAHQAVDRALDERSSELGELEALAARQRRHAEQRVREITGDAEERIREGAKREAELTAKLVRVERELEQIRPQRHR